MENWIGGSHSYMIAGTMATSAKQKVVVAFWPSDKEYYNKVIVPKFPDLDICLSSTPIITKEEYHKNIHDRIYL